MSKIEGDVNNKLLGTNNHDLNNGQIDGKKAQPGKKKGLVICEKNNEKKEMQEWDKVPPDGGWGWLVLLGSTMVNVLVPGTVKSFGVLFVVFVEVFEASPATASWIPALCYFLYSSLGPVSSILSVKYSYRTVTLLGGTFAAAGMILSFFAQSVSALYLTYGTLVGAGAGLSFPPTVYIVTEYFVKRRGLANGLCISGSAIGSIILPPLIDRLLDIYGYRGAVLIMGGITLNVWVAALFYDPVSKHMKKVPREQPQDEDEEADETTSLHKPKFVISTEDNSASMHQLPKNDSFVDNSDIMKNNFVRSASSAAVPSIRHGGRERKVSVPVSRGEMVRARSGGSRGNINSSLTLNAVPETPTAMAMYSQTRLPSSRRTLPKRSPSTSSFQYISTPYHGSTLTLQPETFASSFSLKTASCVQKQTGKETPIRKLFDVSLFKDPLYLIILISNCTNAISYTNFIILLPSYATTLHFDKTQGALLLSVVSAFDLVGRIGGSALSDLGWIPKTWYFVGGLLVSGVALAVLPFTTSYYVLCCFCAVFGLGSGIYVGVTAVIMADMLGTERLQSSYGISLFINGILQLGGPPICGVWFQRTRSYVSLFCTLGCVLVGGASIWGFVPCIKKKTDSQTEEGEAV